MASTGRGEKRKTLYDILSESDNALIVMHRYADVDALASALAFDYVLREKLGYSRTIIICPEGINAFAKSLAKKMEISFECVERLGEIETETLDRERTLVILLDVGGESQLGEFKDLIAGGFRTILVDHHHKNDLKNRVDMRITPSNACSTSEITATLLREHIDDKKIASALLAGIVFDTSRFKRASKMTFSSARFLCELTNYSAVLSLMETEEDLSKRMAKLRGAQRAIVERSGNTVIAVTHVSSYESDVAASLVLLGADISMVVSPKEDGTKITYRITDKVPNELLERVKSKIARELDLVSHGGHRRAGVFVLKGKLNKRELPSFCKKLIDILVQALQ